MDNDLNKEGVETIVEPEIAPAGDEVKIEDPSASQDPLESDAIDYEKEYFALLEKESKTAADRDNYKQGLLAAKGKIPATVDIDTDPSDIDALIEKKVQATLLRTKEFQIQQSKDDLVKKIIAENKELKLALNNKDGISTVSPGSNVSKPPVVKQQWSKEQLEYFKKRGLNPDTVMKNYIKAKSD
jgi:hypothetical protein